MPRPKGARSVAAKAKVSPTGRLSLPAEVRRAVGLENGGTVVVDLQDGAIRLRTMDEVLAGAQATARKIAGDDASVDDFLRFRRDLWRK
jgi:AbrB family looped-hinge helix DNA binding protein